MPHTTLPRIPGFRLLRRLGAGASGAVYQAIQDGTDREVALKLFAPADNPEATLPEDVERERRVAASLHHRNLARIHAIGSYGEQRWLACEYLSGGTLAERIAARMSTEQALDALHHIARGLGHAHARGIVHGDVKPGNVLFRGGADARHAHEAVLVDYGVAAFAHDGCATLQGGTPDYMSPEQARGEPIDGRSDFYSLGVTLHEMLTGRTPPHGQSGEASSPRPVPQLPQRVRWLQPLLDALMAEDPAERPADARALLEMLASLRVASPEAAVLSRPGSESEQLPRIHGIAASRTFMTPRAWATLAALVMAGAVMAALLMR